MRGVRSEKGKATMRWTLKLAGAGFAWCLLVPGVAVAANEGRILMTNYDEYGPDGITVDVMNHDGSGRRTITRGWDAEWSPDGRRIVYAHNYDYDESDISNVYSVRPDGQGVKLLAEDGASHPTWSPDGSTIAYVSFNQGSAYRSEIFLMNADGTDKRNLTNDSAERWDGYSSLRWSPDGSSIVFAKEDEGSDSPAIYVIDVETGEQTALTEPGFTSPAWSPDGSKIAYASIYRSRTAESELFVMDADGSNERQITDNTHREATPTWAANGKAIYYVAEGSANAGSDIYGRTLGGEGRRRLTCAGVSELEPHATSGSWTAREAGTRKAPTTLFATPRRAGYRFAVYVPGGPCEHPRDTCLARRRILVKRKEDGPDPVVRRLRTERSGVVVARLGRGRYYGIVSEKRYTSPEGRPVVCLPDDSRTFD